MHSCLQCDAFKPLFTPAYDMPNLMLACTSKATTLRIEGHDDVSLNRIKLLFNNESNTQGSHPKQHLLNPSHSTSTINFASIKFAGLSSTTVAHPLMSAGEPWQQLIIDDDKDIPRCTTSSLKKKRSFSFLLSIHLQVSCS